MTIRLLAFLAALSLAAPARAEDSAPFLVVLGVAQDAGHPQIGCQKSCCTDPAEGGHRVASLALVEPTAPHRFLFDATPDLPAQLRLLDEIAPARPGQGNLGLTGVFLTHAHIGHYTGLMHFGREAASTRGLKVYAMPRLRAFLRDNGPWSQLVDLGNVELRPIQAGGAIPLGRGVVVTAQPVPHRDEFSETVAYWIEGPERRVLFVPDIDKWEKWDTPLVEAIRSVDRAYVDGTFFDELELPGRDMSEIPHPFIVETLDLVQSLPLEERAKLRFLHLNHTNPALAPGSSARQAIEAAGCGVAEEGERFEL